MKPRLPFLIPLLLVFGLQAGAKDRYPVNPNIDILHYRFTLQLEDTTDRIRVASEIRFHTKGPEGFLELDLTSAGPDGKGMTIREVFLDGSACPFTHRDDRIRISLPDSKVKTADRHLSVTYDGIPRDGLIIGMSKFGKRTFFGDNWPDRARHWLACIDHPSDKATVDFEVTAPAHYNVVGVGQLAGVYRPSGEGLSSSAYLTTIWQERIPIPTKVMVIGAADFAWETAGYSYGIPIQSWVYSDNRAAGFTDYEPAVEITSFFQDLIGPFSYEKLANVQSKTIYGGMENSSCIFYYENSVTGQNRLHSLLAHEIAHQWFGDAVTEKDWHHIWLSEGFATYLEAVCSDSLFKGRTLEESMKSMRAEVIRYHSRSPKPVIDTTITNFMELLSTNSYQKGAWVLHMLRQEVGDEAFWKGIRKFYADYRNDNALTSDFKRVMEEVSGRKLEVFFHQWLEKPGQPALDWSWKYLQTGGKLEIVCNQTQPGTPFEFTLMVEVTLPKTGKIMRYPCRITRSRETFVFDCDQAPSAIRLDPEISLLFTATEPAVRN